MSDPANKYRILVISDYRTVTSSRPEAEIFIGLAQQGHQLTVISFPEAKYYNQRFRDFGIEVLEQHPTRKFSIPFISFLRKLVKTNQFQFVHAFNSHALVNAIWALQQLPAKLIAYRGYAGQTHWYDPMMYLKYFHPRVDKIICLSEEIHTILAHNMPWAKGKLITIHKGHHPDWYKDIIKADRADFNFSSDDILLAFVANVRPFKGLPYLLKATQLIQKDLSLHFLFMGNGYEDPEIQSLIQSSPYQKQIHLLGYRKDSLSIVRMSDGLVLPSTHGEALNKSLIEAMSMGVAPIMTNIEGNRGVVIDGQSGWVVPIKNPEALAVAINDFALHPEKRKQRGVNAQVHIATQFHTHDTVKAYLKMYAGLW